MDTQHMCRFPQRSAMYRAEFLANRHRGQLTRTTLFLRLNPPVARPIIFRGMYPVFRSMADQTNSESWGYDGPSFPLANLVFARGARFGLFLPLDRGVADLNGLTDVQIDGLIHERSGGVNSLVQYR